MENLNIALIGCGMIGREHIESFVRNFNTEFFFKSHD